MFFDIILFYSILFYSILFFDLFFYCILTQTLTLEYNSVIFAVGRGPSPVPRVRCTRGGWVYRDPRYRPSYQPVSPPHTPLLRLLLSCLRQSNTPPLSAGHPAHTSQSTDRDRQRNNHPHRYINKSFHQITFWQTKCKHESDWSLLTVFVQSVKYQLVTQGPI